MKCSEVMKRDVRSCQPTETAADVAAAMRDRDIGFVPICEPGGKVVGTITDRDLALRVVAEQRAPATTRAQDVMTREVIACKPDDDLNVAERIMSERQKSRILCIDSSGRLQGVISFADLAAADKATRTGDVLRSVKAAEARPH